MKTLKFYGSSDDLFCMDSSNPKEDNEFSPGVVSVTVVDDVGPVGLMVTADYNVGHNGCWAIGVCQLAEDEKLPPWPMWFEVAPRGYSVMLCISVPDDAYVKQVKR